MRTAKGYCQRCGENDADRISGRCNGVPGSNHDWNHGPAFETRTPEQIEREDYPASTPPARKPARFEGWAIVYYSDCGVVAGNVCEYAFLGDKYLAVFDKAGALVTMLAPREIRQIKPCTEAEAMAKSEHIAASNKALDAVLKSSEVREAFNKAR